MNKKPEPQKAGLVETLSIPILLAFIAIEIAINGPSTWAHVVAMFKFWGW